MNQIDVTYKFFIDDFELFIFEIVDGIQAICPDYSVLVNLWHIKDTSYFGAN